MAQQQPRPWTALLVGAVLIGTIGCAKEAPLPPVPPPPEDLSTWGVPELIQPPAPTPVALQALPVEEKTTAAEKLYPWTPGTSYVATVPIGWPLDIILERGEQIRNIVGGDRAPAEEGKAPRWDVKEGAEGHGETQRPHVFVAATEPGLTIGLIVTTTKRTYYLTCKSAAQSPTRALRWSYPPELRETPPLAPEPLAPLPHPTRPARYHTGYVLQGSHPLPAWAPRQVVDDGKKLYIVYPEVALFGTVPLVRIIGPNGPALVNARQVLNVVIVDHLPARVELRIGTGERAETITITRGALRTITCPEDADCPAWPPVTATLAGRLP